MCLREPAQVKDGKKRALQPRSHISPSFSRVVATNHPHLGIVFLHLNLRQIFLNRNGNVRDEGVVVVPKEFVIVHAGIYRGSRRRKMLPGRCKSNPAFTDTDGDGVKGWWREISRIVEFFGKPLSRHHKRQTGKKSNGKAVIPACRVNPTNSHANQSSRCREEMQERGVVKTSQIQPCFGHLNSTPLTTGAPVACIACMTRLDGSC